MKYNGMLRAMGLVLNGIVKEGIPEKKTRKAIQSGYREILERASDIGSRNNLLSSYGLAAWFLAMNRNDGRNPEENIRILETGMRKSKALKRFLGDSRGYFSEKHMQFRRDWSRKTQERKYPNDWVVDVLEKDGKYEFGLDYRECGVCKLCADEGCPELAKYLCRLDFMLVDLIGVGLDRTETLADGGKKCDFRFYRKEQS